MPDLNQQLKTLQAAIDALQPGDSRDQLQSDLNLVTTVLGALPHRIEEAISWQQAYAKGAVIARDRLTDAMHEALAPPPLPPKSTTH